MAQFVLPPPELQLDFVIALETIRELCLQEALRSTVSTMDIPIVDDELARLVPRESLSALASAGLRAELVFPVPSILRENPRLLAYYRLLLGFSQKAFYTKTSGLSCFKSMEERGHLSKRNEESLERLCVAVSEASALLINGIGISRLSQALLDDLTLLTLGAQLRGGVNVKKGSAAIDLIFNLIQRIVKNAIIPSTKTQAKIELLNSSGRRVFIQFASDPDIIIREEIGPNRFRNIIAIEIKGGTDFSNIHNRLGEAEKSHQKARQAEFTECWTIVNVEHMDLTKARRESPSTNRFYKISDLSKEQGLEFEDFRARIIALAGISNS